MVWNKINLDREAVVRKYNELKSLRKTAKYFSVSHGPIKRILDECNIDISNNKWYDDKIKMEEHKNRMVGNKLGLGYKHTDKFKKRLSEMRTGNKNHQFGKRREKCPNWKGGKTEKNTLFRQSLEYRDWRSKIFERDNYTCQLTGRYGDVLQVHHLNSFNTSHDERLDKNNGITLSADIHKLFHDIYGKGNNTVEQFNEFKEIFNI